MGKQRIRSRQALAVAVTLASTSVVGAATRTYSTTATSNAWINANNWIPNSNFAGVDASASTTTDGAADDIAVLGNLNFASASGLGINFNTAGGSLTLAAINSTGNGGTGGGTSLLIGNSSGAAGTLQLNGATIDPGSGSLDKVLISVSSTATKNLTLNPTVGSGSQPMTLRLGIADGSMYVNTGRSLTLGVVVSELNAGSSITKLGGGSLIVTGTLGTTGGIVSKGGTISIQSAGSLGNNNLTFDASGTLAWQNTTSLTVSGGVSISSNVTTTLSTNGLTTTLAGPISGSGHLTKDLSGTAILAADNTYSGTTSVSQGSLQIGNGGTSGSLGSGDVSVQQFAALIFNRSNDSSVANLISGGGRLTKNGGGTVTLSNAGNTFSGPILINAGILEVASLADIGSASALGAGDATSNTTNANSLVLNGGTLRYSGGGVSASRNFAINTFGGTIDASGGGAVTLSSTGDISSTTPTHAGTWSIGGTTINLTRSWTTEDLLVGMTLTGSAFQSGTTITGFNGSTVSISAGALAAGTNANVNVIGGPDRTLTLTVANPGDNTLAGTLRDPGNGVKLHLVKSGAGAWVLTRATSDYSGETSIAGGVLKLSANGAINNTSAINLVGGSLDVSAKTAFTIGAAQLLRGDGAVTGASGNNAVNGVVLVGSSHGVAGSAGTISVSGGTVELAGDLQLDLFSASNDRLVTGAVQYGGTLTVSDQSGLTLVEGMSWDLIDGTRVGSLEFSNFVLPTLSDPELSWKFDYNSGTLVVVPEPASLAIITALAGTTLLARRRRRTHRLDHAV